jgi:hypothetical protein
MMTIFRSRRSVAMMLDKREGTLSIKEGSTFGRCLVEVVWRNQSKAEISVVLNNLFHNVIAPP